MTDDDKTPNWCSETLPCGRYEILSAENERLREALEAIAQNDDFVTERPPIRPQWSREQCSSIARAALGELQ